MKSSKILFPIFTFQSGVLNHTSIRSYSKSYFIVFNHSYLHCCNNKYERLEIQTNQFFSTKRYAIKLNKNEKKFYSRLSIDQAVLPPNAQFQKIRFLSLLENKRFQLAYTLLNEIGEESILYPNLKLLLLLKEEKIKDLESYFKQIFDKSLEDSETFEIWMEMNLKYFPETLHDAYATIMRREDIIPTIRTLQIILHATDSEQFLTHSINKVLDTLSFEIQNHPQIIMRKKSEIALLLSEAFKKCMDYQHLELAQMIVLRHKTLNIPFNFEISQKIVTFFCVSQNFDFAIRFITTLIPKLDSNLRYNDSSSFIPLNLLLVVLHIAAEYGYSEIIENVVHEILNILRCEITSLKPPYNSIILHAVFKGYLLNENFDQAFETIIRMKDCNVQLNQNFVVPLLRMYLGAQDDPEEALRNLINILKQNRELITIDTVILLIKAMGNNLKLSQSLFKEFSYVEPQAPKELALAQIYAQHKKPEDSYTLFTKAIERNTLLDQEEIAEYCRMFFPYSIESSIEVFICLYQMYKEKTSQKLLVQLLRRAKKIGDRPFQNLLDRLKETISQEHWPYFEEVISRTRRNLDAGPTQKERFTINENNLTYLVPDEL